MDRTCPQIPHPKKDILFIYNSVGNAPVESSHEELDQPKMRNESTRTKRLVFKRAKRG